MVCLSLLIMACLPLLIMVCLSLLIMVCLSLLIMVIWSPGHMDHLVTWSQWEQRECIA